jgi:ParB-like chromosome segregation protein Spo0J
MATKIAPSLKWRDDPDAETILRNIAQLPFVVETISLSVIDWAESANNCARLTDPLNKEKIDDYANCMRNGDVFPRIVVERQKKKSGYVILGGNQRSAALKSLDASASIECYVVDPLTTGERELVIRSLNSRHGWGSTKEERIEHAVFLVRKYGMRVDDVARAMVVGVTSINNRIRSENERVRLAKAGIDAASMSQSALSAISSIADLSLRDVVAKAAVETKATGEKACELSAAVAKAGSKAAASSAIADFKKSASAMDQLKKSARGGIKKPRRERFLDLIGRLSDFLERGNDGAAFSTLDELSCSVEHDLDNVRVLTAKITGRLHCICEAGK